MVMILMWCCTISLYSSENIGQLVQFQRELGYIKSVQEESESSVEKTVTKQKLRKVPIPAYSNMKSIYDIVTSKESRSHNFLRTLDEFSRKLKESPDMKSLEKISSELLLLLTKIETLQQTLGRIKKASKKSVWNKFNNKDDLVRNFFLFKGESSEKVIVVNENIKRAEEVLQDVKNEITNMILQSNEALAKVTSEKASVPEPVLEAPKPFDITVEVQATMSELIDDNEAFVEKIAELVEKMSTQHTLPTEDVLKEADLKAFKGSVITEVVEKREIPISRDKYFVTQMKEYVYDESNALEEWLKTGFNQDFKSLEAASLATNMSDEEISSIQKTLLVVKRNLQKYNALFEQFKSRPRSWWLEFWSYVRVYIADMFYKVTVPKGIKLARRYSTGSISTGIDGGVGSVVPPLNLGVASKEGSESRVAAENRMFELQSKIDQVEHDLNVIKSKSL